ncbi:MAG: YceI family protein [Sandaracinaceae bacterium]|nr:YceI family protein [Sandaracinaceae bacterium]
MRADLSLFAFILLVGCSDPAATVPSAQVEQTPATPSAPTGDPGPSDDRPEGALAIDTARSTLEFVGSKVTGSHTGHFGEWSGWLVIGEPIAQSRVRIDIQMATIEADVDRLTRHLRTDDFFDVARFPTARFESTAFAPAPEGTEEATHLVTGRLTIRDTTQTITFPVNLETSDAEVRARARFAIDRQQWGINYRGMEDDLIRDQVIIRFDVRAPRG